MSKNLIKKQQNNKIAFRVRNMSILLLSSVLLLIILMVAVIVTDITSNASEDLARYYSIEAVDKFTIFISRALYLGERISHLKTVSSWFTDEDNPVKKRAAYNELMDTADLPYSAGIYFVVEKSLHEYSFNSKMTYNELLPYHILAPDNPEDYWYYDCLASNTKYSLNIDYDRNNYTRRFWINQKVIDDNDIVGVFSSGLPFEEMAYNLFSHYDSRYVKGYIIDKNIDIQMDSHDFYTDMASNDDNIQKLRSNPEFVSAIKLFSENNDGFFNSDMVPVLIKLDKGSFRYVSFAPITNTNWIVVIFFNNKLLFSFTKLLPLIIALLSGFLFYTMAEIILIRRTVLDPLAGLTESIPANEKDSVEIFGLDRDDEIGELAKTIHKMREGLLKASDEQERLMRTDQLTNIPNRRYFDERLPEEWDRAVRTKTPISMLMLDLDHFKTYNDTYGHLNGDRVLQAVSKIFIKEKKRPADFVVRWGGEEFVVILPETDSQGAIYLAENIRKSVEETEILLDSGTKTKITVSIGVNSLIPDQNSLYNDFIRNADDALYKAKEDGRNRFCLYSPEQHL
jgi:diguanylate cyclase (GGDEF)-like protein